MDNNIKQWINKKIDEITKWNQYSAIRIKKNSIKENKYDSIIIRTNYLDDRVKFTERIYHILNDFFEPIKCNYCEKNILNFNGFINGYHKCCNDRTCMTKSKIENIDGNGLNGFERAAINSNITKSKIGEDGLTIPQRAVLKQKNTKLNDIDENGLNGYHRAAIRGATTKYIHIDDDGFNTHEKTGLKIKRALAKIDETTGLKKSKVRAIKIAKAKLNDIDENGLNGYHRAAIKTKNTRLNDIDENGLNSYQRAIKRAVKTVKNTIYDTGLQGYAHIIYEANKTRTLNNSLKFGHFSKECFNMIREIDNRFELDKNPSIDIYYVDDKNRNEWFETNLSGNITYVQYDFVIRNKNTKNVILVIEYHGSAFHINEETYIEYKNDNREILNPFGNSLIESYEKDQIKKKYMINKYNCEYLEIFDFDWSNNKNQILNDLNKILKDIL